MFEMDLEEDASSKTRLKDNIRSPIMLPSLSLSRPSSRLGTTRSGSPASSALRKPSVSAGCLNMLEHQLDGSHIDPDYEDMADRVQVEVPIIDDFVNEDAVHGYSNASCSLVVHDNNSNILQRMGDSHQSTCSDAAADATTGVDGESGNRDTSSQPRVSVEDFSVLHLIGKGGYGKVYLVRHKLTGKHYAMKVLRKASILLQRRQIGFTMTERTILSEVQHPFIVKLYYAFQSNSKLFLIMEYVAGGELFTHMANERIFSEDQATFYAAELVLAISHLHRLGIMFRDTKPENCLLNRNGHLVLTDFGLSKTALGGDGRASTFCGTPAYMAPEILNSSDSYDFSVDWWSLGVLIYEMLIGSVPFKGKAPAQVAKNIAKMKVNYPNYMTPDAQDLVRRLLRKTPAQRISYGPKGVENIRKHRFFRKIDWARLEKNHESLTPPIIPAVSGDADVSNFATEFTEEQLPPSLALHGEVDEHEPLPDAPPISTAPNPVRGNHAKVESEVDPATAFLGFSFVANSVMDTIRLPQSP
ncbi:hypothetical protein H4R24_003876 [Coemansia sp. RSA 988]|nr:hypothetical protein H4R24_003876 [Coemansia sp. RSA 988]